MSASLTSPAKRAHWSWVGLVFLVAAAFCVFWVTLAALFFILGGFVFFVFKRYVAFALIVAVPALVLSVFAALVAASPGGFPSPIGDPASEPAVSDE
ncbi:MAG TPA: hypothetical protein VFI56_03495 [Vicinamibacterales bacterium]|nr:hypothetical protein [Vicinamibacterales bacterium]